MGKNHSVTYINDQNQFLNTHKTENVTYSSVNTELKENEEHLTLLNYDDYFLISGHKFIEYLANRKDDYGRGSVCADYQDLSSDIEYKVYGHPEKWKLLFSQNELLSCGILSVVNVASNDNKIHLSSKLMSKECRM